MFAQFVMQKVHYNVCLLTFQLLNQGIARTQSPTNKNYAFELPTFGVIAGVNPTEVQWKGLTLEEPPCWSRLTSTPGKYADRVYSFYFEKCRPHISME